MEIQQIIFYGKEPISFKLVLGNEIHQLQKASKMAIRSLKGDYLFCGQNRCPYDCFTF